MGIQDPISVRGTYVNNRNDGPWWIDIDGEEEYRISICENEMIGILERSLQKDVFITIYPNGLCSIRETNKKSSQPIHLQRVEAHRARSHARPIP